jgi:LuxR family maltose regulon positive regulatory protein
MNDTNTPDFNVELLDGLLADNDFQQLKEKLLFILKHCSGIDWIFLLNKYIFAFPEDEIIKTPQFATFAAVSASIRGDIGKAQYYAQHLGNSLLLSHYITVYMPFTDNKAFRKSMEYLKNTTNFNAVFCSNKPSVINGIRDFTRYSRFLELMEKPLKNMLYDIYGSSCLGIYDVSLAEYYYQQNRCYDALALVEGVINSLQQRGNPAVLQAALFVQLCVLVAKGQITELQSYIDEFELRIQKVNYSLYPNYISSLRIWCDIYVGNYSRCEEWLNKDSPIDTEDFTIMDIFNVMVKLRVYLQLGKYYLLISAVIRLIPRLESWHRDMDLCEANLLYAMALFSDNNLKKAYDVLDSILPLVRRRGYFRLVADEGQKMYQMLRSYKKDRNISDDFLDMLITLSKETGLMYPDYLKKISTNYPKLTDTEKNVLILMAQEHSNSEIADYMNVSINTIKFHSKNIFQKLNVSNRHQAIKAGFEAAIIPTTGTSIYQRRLTGSNV